MSRDSFAPREIHNTYSPAENRDPFTQYHPVVNLLYFVLVIGCAMVLQHPICLVISLFGALMYGVCLKGRKIFRYNIVYMLPIMILTAVVNPVFTHQGVTILTYLPSGNPLTLESILYGVFAAMLMICVVAWFSCFHVVMNSDKFVYLFGRIIPALSLLLSMALRFVPRCIERIRVIADAQRCIGRDASHGGLLRRAKHGIRIMGILVTWALENSIDTADSMKSRGYGLPGRSAFSIYRWDYRDRKALLFLLPVGAVIVIATILGQFRFIYYPILQGASSSITQNILFVLYIAMCAMPTYLYLRERSIVAPA